MNFSTNGPTLEEYLIAQAAGAPLLPMNVSVEADEAYRREKKLRFNNKPRTDRDFARQEAGWEKLIRKRYAQSGVLPTGWIVCAYEFCKLPFKPARRGTVCCSPRCKRYHDMAQPTKPADLHETAA